MSKNTASNGNFGFGKPVSNSTSGNSGFADFSSAFGGPSSDITNTKTDQDLFNSEAGIPAPPSPQETSTGFDLFATTGNNTSTKQTKNSDLADLLGGFGGGGSDSLTSMPNLMSAPQIQGSTGIHPQQSLFGGPTSLIGINSPSNTSLPALQPTSTLNPFQPPHQPNPSALIDSPVLAPTEFNSSNSGMIGSGGVDQQDKKAAKLPSTWNDVGSLNMDLANFSLSNPNQKKAAMSMNAMKMSQSSSKTPSPLSPVGKSGFPAPAAPNLKPQNPGSFDLL